MNEKPEIESILGEKTAQMDDNTHKTAQDRVHRIISGLGYVGLFNGESMSTAIISRLEDMGRARSRLSDILDDEIFDTLSKYNEYYHSEHEAEDEKLDELRRKLVCIKDNLWDLWAILRNDEDL